MQTLEPNSPIRETNLGKIQGLWVEERGTLAEVYLGVPYATPPLGRLRYEVHKIRKTKKDLFK